jgi:hypothetical protein
VLLVVSLIILSRDFFFFLVVVFDNIIQFKNKTKKLAGIFKKNLSPAIYIYLHAHILAPP